MVVRWYTTVFILLAANIVLQGLDIWTTLEALRMGATEENVFSRFIMETMGIGTWVAIKGLLIVGLVAAMVWIRKVDDHTMQQTAFPAGFLVVWMAGVVWGNLRVLGII